MADREQQVREIAHRLWEEEGCPSGEDKRHWATAENIVAQSDHASGAAQSTSPPAAKRARTRKPATEGKAERASAGRLTGGALTH
jgi:hypothetical protein